MIISYITLHDIILYCKILNNFCGDFRLQVFPLKIIYMLQGTPWDTRFSYTFYGGNICRVSIQNTAISFKAIHFFNKIKLILYPQVRNSISHLTLVKIVALYDLAGVWNFCQLGKAVASLRWPRQPLIGGGSGGDAAVRHNWGQRRPMAQVVVLPTACF